jgi:hypothetical protein
MDYRARVLRERPDLDQLKRQAKELLAAFVAGELTAVEEVNRHYRAADASTFALHDAQLVLARAYGFDSCPSSKRMWTVSPSNVWPTPFRPAMCTPCVQC